MNYTNLSETTLKALEAAGATCENRCRTMPKETQELLSLYPAIFGNAANEKLAWNFLFQNYGASVVKGLGTYGEAYDLWEVAVLKRSGSGWRLCYDTPITDDVIGFCDEQRVLDLVLDIALFDRGEGV